MAQRDSYTETDPQDPPMVEVLVDGHWYDGQVRAQWRDATGAWRIAVEYSKAPGMGGRGTFAEADVRPDTTDYSRGRS